MFGIKSTIRHIIASKKWRHENPHNDTRLGKWCINSSKIKIGRYTYGDINILTAGSTPCLVIGDFCSIAKEVTFVIDNSHPLDNLSTYPFKVKAIKSDKCEALSKGGITIGDDVWIGYRATILDGVTIGRGAVIAAGAVVANDVEPYSVVGGVPASVIRKRFNEELIRQLLDFDYSVIDRNWIDSHFSELYSRLDKNVIIKLIG